MLAYLLASETRDFFSNFQPKHSTILQTAEFGVPLMKLLSGWGVIKSSFVKYVSQFTCYPPWGPGGLHDGLCPPLRTRSSSRTPRCSPGHRGWPRSRRRGHRARPRPYPGPHPQGHWSVAGSRWTKKVKSKINLWALPVTTKKISYESYATPWARCRNLNMDYESKFDCVISDCYS